MRQPHLVILSNAKNPSSCLPASCHSEQREESIFTPLHLPAFPPLRDDQVENGRLTYITEPQKEALYLARADRAKRQVRKDMPFIDYLSDYGQAIALIMPYNMGGGSADSGHGLASFKNFIDYAAKGDNYNAGLEMLRSKRSEDIRGRNLAEALIFCTDGDPRVTGKDRLDDYKNMVTAAYKTREDKSETYAQVMEELYRQEAARLGYGPNAK